MTLYLVFDENGTALCHDLAKDYSWNHGVAGEVTAGEEFIFFDTVLSVSFALLVYPGLLYEKHRLAVREVLFDLFFVKHVL